MTVEALLEFEAVSITEDPRVPERETAARFVGVYQAADNWCWAAATASVLTSFDPTRKLRDCVHAQCLVVERFRGAETACRTPSYRGECERFRADAGGGDAWRSACLNDEEDKQGFLNRALDKHGLLAGWVSLRSGRARTSTRIPPAEVPTLDDGMDIDDFNKLLQKGHLICLRTRRRGSRHFIIIYGCETYPEYSLLIWDTAHGTDVIEADRLHLEHGPFTHKIVTRSLTVSP